MKNVSFQSPEVLSNRTNHAVAWKWNSGINGLISNSTTNMLTFALPTSQPELGAGSTRLLMPSKEGEVLCLRRWKKNSGARLLHHYISYAGFPKFKITPNLGVICHVMTKYLLCSIGVPNTKCLCILVHHGTIEIGFVNTPYLLLW